jgi:hypothetical protein
VTHPKIWDKLPVRGCFGDYWEEDDACMSCEHDVKFACLLVVIKQLQWEEKYWADKWHEKTVQADYLEKELIEAKRRIKVFEDARTSVLKVPESWIREFQEAMEQERLMDELDEYRRNDPTRNLLNDSEGDNEEE